MAESGLGPRPSVPEALLTCLLRPSTPYTPPRLHANTGATCVRKAHLQARRLAPVLMPPPPVPPSSRQGSSSHRCARPPLPPPPRAHAHTLTPAPSLPGTAGSRSWCLERKLSLKKSLWPALTVTPLSLHPSSACRDLLIPPPPCSPRVSDRLQRPLVPQRVSIQAPGGREPECVVNECGLQPPGSSRQCGKKAWLELHRLRHCSLSHPIQRAVGLHPGLNFCSAACQLGGLGLVI